MRIMAALFFVAALPAAAQKVEVPAKLDFAGITLIIRDDARREIQKDVDALTASPRHYQIKAERAKTYFPIIEEVFRKEGLPDDFKSSQMLSPLPTQSVSGNSRISLPLKWACVSTAKSTSG
jgi:membrane-bound lytic murein transglycosylase D